uniref:CCHC-type domain-containing protein n=1 Tax=Setaria viridis TaxID=4556 RepID=A0A4U6UIB0_SETVI|nr:hypothetical protein SEVIR_5G217700v2 [Setaria viridis]
MLRRDGGSDRSRRSHSRRPPTKALLAFKRETAGRCFRCLATDHLASACRDPVRCFRCRQFGHREPEPRARAPASHPPTHKAPTSTRCQPPAIPHHTASVDSRPRLRLSPAVRHPPSEPTRTTAKMAIGDPHTRPEVETVFVSSSFHLEHDARDWEACALVPWALHLPPDAGARDIANLLT